MNFPRRLLKLKTVPCKGRRETGYDIAAGGYHAEHRTLIGERDARLIGAHEEDRRVGDVEADHGDVEVVRGHPVAAAAAARLLRVGGRGLAGVGVAGGALAANPRRFRVADRAPPLLGQGLPSHQHVAGRFLFDRGAAQPAVVAEGQVLDQEAAGVARDDGGKMAGFPVHDSRRRDLRSPLALDRPQVQPRLARGSFGDVTTLPLETIQGLVRV